MEEKYSGLMEHVSIGSENIEKRYFLSSCNVFFSLKRKVLLLIGLLLMPLALQLSAQVNTDDLTRLDLEELMKIEVTSVSKKSEKLSDAPAAIFVISQEDIRRSGATSIPEALRMAPGLQVARIDASKWAVTSRGFNGRFANKLLILIDGRSVYTPLYSGVFWNNQDAFLSDIERIEVIRGPGATLWGSNAVNGVINIITKHTRDTQSGLAVMRAGSEDRLLTGVRYGGNSGEDLFYRIYGKYVETDESVFTSGDNATDDWESLRGGFRVDLNANERNSFQIIGDSHTGYMGDRTAFVTPGGVEFWDERIEFSGSSLIANWNLAMGEYSRLSLRGYFDRTDYNSRLLGERRDTYDFDMDHSFRIGSRNEIVWGIGYRTSSDRLNNSSLLLFHPSRRVYDVYSAFLQDNITLIEEKLNLIVGTKIEENEFTDLEIQPNVRLMWHPVSDLSIWGSVSRAVRTPSRAENDLTTYVSGIPISGSSDFDSERLTAYEAGIRKGFGEAFFADVVFFMNDYDKLRTLEMKGIYPFLTIDADNKMEGWTHGVEVLLSFQPFSRFKLVGTYTFIDMMLDTDADSLDLSSERNIEGETPEHQFSLRAQSHLTDNTEFDFIIRYTDRLKSQDVDGYYNLDLRIGYHLTPSIMVEVVGQNLTDAHHQEYVPEILGTEAIEIERGIYGKLTLLF